MDLELSDEQLELRATISAVLTKESPPTLARDVTEGRADTSALWQTFVALGWPALTIAEHFGGIGLGAVEAATLCEELGKVLAGTPLLPTITQFVPLVSACASTDQQQQWLSAVANGTCRATAAIAEETGSYDPARTTATASRSDGGYTLHGVKRYAAELDHCDVVACTVLVDGRPAVAVVDTAAVAITRIDPVDRTRSYAHIDLSGVHVAADRLLLDGTLDEIRDAIEYAAMALAMETVGVCNSIFDITLEYAKQRQQFGVPIGSFQAIKHKFADLVIALERARSLGYFAALCISESDPRRHMAVAAAKAAAGDAQRALGKEGIQIHGGIGYTWEHDMHLYVKRAKSNDQVFGTAASHRAHIADLLGV